MTDLDDKDLFDQLEKAALSDKLKGSPEWKLLQEAADRIVDRAVNQLVLLQLTPESMYKAMTLQTIIRKYKHDLFGEIDFLVKEGEKAFEEASDREILE